MAGADGPHLARRRELIAVALTVYADFGSPECYLASRRVDALVAAGVDIYWRAVEHEPWLPPASRPLGADDRAEEQTRMTGLATLLIPGEDLPWSPHVLEPSTEAAVSGYAEAYDVGVGDDVRRLLYTAYRIEDADIGSPEVRAACSAARGPRIADPRRTA